MAEFQKYRSEGGTPRDTSVNVRVAMLGDALAIAKVLVETEGGNETDHFNSLTTEIAQQNESEASIVLFVAAVGDQVAGFARAGYFVPPEDAPDNCVPQGWYLQGVIVSPGYRGRGIGSFLTQSRLEWLAGRTLVVRYFASSDETTTTELPKELGFREVRRNVWAPKTLFSEEGPGILYGRELDRKQLTRNRMPVTLRLATTDDAEQIAQISAAAEGQDTMDLLSGVREEIALQHASEPSTVLFVAESGATVIGFARAGYFVPPDPAPDRCIPEGWYLQGVVVSPDQRGQGIASFLTRSRLDWLANRTNVVRYFVNSESTDAVELPQELGFREVRRSVWAPGTVFSGEGTGVLYELPMGRQQLMSQAVPS